MIHWFWLIPTFAISFPLGWYSATRFFGSLVRASHSRSECQNIAAKIKEHAFRPHRGNHA